MVDHDDEGAAQAGGPAPGRSGRRPASASGRSQQKPRSGSRPASGRRPAAAGPRAKSRPAASAQRRRSAESPTVRQAKRWLAEHAPWFDPITAALVVVPLLVFMVMSWRWRWTHDDGFITLRVVDQVFAGHGPVYNRGQRVEAFTSPLHLGALIVLRAAFGWAIDVARAGAVLTILAATAGLAAATLGSARLVRAGGAKGRLLPLGLLVPATLPPMWEYATSGLEVGIAIGWVGVSFCWLAHVLTRPAAEPSDPDDAAGPRVRRLWPVAMFVGLGPLVRPECTVFTIAFLGALVASAQVESRWWPRTRLVLAGLALPFAYQVFRMGYYAALVPNTALAKTAGGSRWGQGWYYLVNFVGPYGLVFPAAVFGVWLWFGRRRSFTRTFGGVDGRNLVAALVVAALVYGLYVVRVGGDYMHARMLLVPAFALCSPLAVVAVPKALVARRVAYGCTAALALWAGVVLVSRRAPEPESFFGGHSISEQRPFWVAFSANAHPVALSDWKYSYPWTVGDKARGNQREGRDVLMTRIGYGGITLPEETPLAPGSGTKLFLDGIGVAGARAGVDVPVIDLHGLAEPVASRMPPVTPRQLPGHEKVLPQPWALAVAGLTEGSPAVVDAAAALRCGQLRDLEHAIAAPMSPSRFFTNILQSPALTTMTVPRAPSDSAVGCARVS